jgi:hypothetical protein
MKTGYKATYDYICINHKFEIGHSYELSHKPIPCQYGFHYCVNPKDVLHYYPIQHKFRLLEIEDLGESITEGDKSVTNKIRIIREVPKEEYYPLFGIVNNKLKFVNIFGCLEKREFDERNNCIYYEKSNGDWQKYTYDERNNKIRYEESGGYWVKHEYDERNNQIYYEDSNGYWDKYTYDVNNNYLKTERGHK